MNQYFLTATLLLSALFANSQSFPVTEAIYITPPSTTRALDKTKPTVALEGVVNINNGTANYSLPITLPQGINGMQPNLSINYSSSAGNGQLGLGWATNAVSVITRGGSNHLVDGAAAPLQLTGDDNLYFDGQRLVAYQGGGFSANSEYRTLNKTYQKIKFDDSGNHIVVTQKDGVKKYYGLTADSRLSLTNVNTSQTGTFAWYLEKVEDRNGNYMLYDYEINTTTHEVRLNKISYAGNVSENAQPKTEVQFKYMNRTDSRTGYLAGNELQSTVLLQEIVVMHNSQQYSKYTLNYAFDNTPKLGKDFSKLVEIEYQAQTEELNSIIVEWPIQNQEMTLENELGLSSYLTDYSLDNYTGFDYEKLSGQVITGDFNADGKTDHLILKHSPKKLGECWAGIYKRRMSEHEFEVIAKYANSNSPQSFNTTTVVHKFISQIKYRECEREGYARIYSGDFNGDGYLDFVLHRVYYSSSEPWNEYKAQVYLNTASNPGNFTYSPSYSTTTNNLVLCLAGVHAWHPDSPRSTDAPYTLLVSDFDGDGLTDLAYAVEYLDFYSPYLSTLKVSAKILYAESTGQFTPEEYDISSNKALDSTYLGDFNGDGVGDLLMLNGGTTSNIVSFAGRQFNEIYSGGFPNGYQYVQLGDFNADGNTDVIVHTGSNQWLMNYFNGVDFEWPHINLTSTFNTNLAEKFNGSRPIGLSNLPWPRVMDVDGDGRSDVVFVKYTSVEIHYNKITGWENSSIGINQISLEPGIGYTNRYFRNLFVVDYNGDGSQNLSYLIPYRDKSFYIDFRPNDQTHRISKILDGSNKLIEFDYAPLTNSSVYNASGTSTYPNPKIVAPMYVVRGFTQKLFDNTLVADKSFFYTGAHYNSIGLGFLGYDKVETTDNIQQTFHLLEFELPQLDPNQIAITSGSRPKQLVKEEQRLNHSAGTKLSERQLIYNNDFVFTHNDIDPFQYQFEIEKTIEINHLLGTSAETDYTYDGYGNLTAKITKTYNNINQTSPYVSQTEEVHSFAHSNGSWLVWLPNASTVVKTRYGETPVTRNTNFTYYNNGNLKSSIQDPGKVVEKKLEFEYDGFGNIDKETLTPHNIAARVVERTYTPDGRFLASETNAKNWTNQYEYNDLLGVVDKSTDFNGLITEWEYDEFGRTTKLIRPDGTEQETAYNWKTGGGGAYLLYETVITGTAQPEKMIRRDGLGRKCQTFVKNQNDVWNIVIHAYNGKGQLFKESQPFLAGQTPIYNVRTYYADNRLHTSTDVVGNTITYTYSGTTTTANHSNGKSSSKTIDADGLVLSATDNGGSIAYTYNSYGKPLTITGPSGTPIQMEYDNFGRQTVLNDAAAGPTSYGYDALDRLITQTDNSGNVYTMTYDELDRLTAKDGPEGIYTNTYDQTFKGELYSRMAPNGNEQITEYDNLGRLSNYFETIGGNTYSFTYAYNNDGQRQEMIYPNGFGLEYIYDAKGYLSQISNILTHEPIWTYGDVNEFGQITEYDLGNTTWNKGFDSQSGLPTSVENDKSWRYNYSFDNATGNLLTRENVHQGLAESFTYDNLDRLKTYNTQQSTFSTNYDAAGNMLNKTDAGTFTNQLATGRTLSVSHASSDPDASISDESQAIDYTAFHSASHISEEDYDAWLTYGADQQRKHMTIDYQGNTVTDRYYIGHGLYERDQLPNGEWRNLCYVNTPTGQQAVYIKNEATNDQGIFYLHTDYQGSILAIADEAGFVLEEFSYDPWGNRRNPTTWANIYTNTSNPTAISTGNALWNNFYRGYTGHEHLDAFAIINMNGRIYAPVLGRMLSPDNYVQNPSSTQSLNRYAYVMNNPLKFTDPSGEIAFAPILVGMAYGAVIGAAVSGAVYSVSTLATGQQWNWSAFGKSVAFGAVGGAIGGGLGSIGAQIGISQNIAYNVLSNVASNSATTLAFGGDITAGGLIGMVAGGFIGAGIGNFNGVQGNALKNIGAELGFGVLKGAATGGFGGAIGAGIDGGDIKQGFVQGAKYGAIAGGTTASLNILTMGAAYKPSRSYGDFGRDGPVYRRGTFITRALAGGGSGIALGRNLVTHQLKENRGYRRGFDYEDYNNYLRAHETGHFQQQEGMGFANFYDRTLGEYLKIGFGNVYGTSGTLEYEADRYSLNRIGYYYHNGVRYTY